MEKFFKAALSVGGLGTVGAFVFYSLYKDWLKLDIFEKLSADQTFTIMLVFLSLVFLCFLALIITYLLKGANINSAKADHNSVATINTK